MLGLYSAVNKSEVDCGLHTLRYTLSGEDTSVSSTRASTCATGTGSRCTALLTLLSDCQLVLRDIGRFWRSIDAKHTCSYFAHTCARIFVHSFVSSSEFYKHEVYQNIA
eukprot:3149228-Amphidinium_carterae.1